MEILNGEDRGIAKKWGKLREINDLMGVWTMTKVGGMVVRGVSTGFQGNTLLKKLKVFHEFI